MEWVLGLKNLVMPVCLIAWVGGGRSVGVGLGVVIRVSCVASAGLGIGTKKRLILPGFGGVGETGWRGCCDEKFRVGKLRYFWLGLIAIFFLTHFLNSVLNFASFGSLLRFSSNLLKILGPLKRKLSLDIDSLEFVSSIQPDLPPLNFIPLALVIFILLDR